MELSGHPIQDIIEELLARGGEIVPPEEIPEPVEGEVWLRIRIPDENSPLVRTGNFW